MAKHKQSQVSRQKQLENIKLLWQLKNKQFAVNQCQDFLRQNPEHAPAHLVYAGFLRDSGKLQEAIKHYQAACGLADTTPQCFLDFAQFLKKVNRSQNAQEVLTVGHKKWPQHAQITRELGVVLAENDHHFEAEQTFERCLQQQPDDWVCWNHLGCSRTLSGHAEQALECFEKCLTLIEKSPRLGASESDIESIKLNNAKALTYAGKTAEAQEMLEEVLRQNPESHRAWLDLSNLIECDSQQIEKMERYLEKAKRSGNRDAIRSLSFALGRSWDNAKAPQKAISHFDEGNKIVRATLDYNSAEVCDRIRRTPDHFPPPLLRDLATSSPKSELLHRPVFIVGMPRSGSTLTEQILASHPQVVGAGELTTLAKIKKELLGENSGTKDEYMELVRSPKTANQLRSAYLRQIERIAHDMCPDLNPENGEVLVIDKMLGNFDMIGMIVKAMPEARIIHCRRNPVDTCLSCYSKLFISPVNYSYDQKEVAEFYNAYEEQMIYWHKHVPSSALMESCYEDMVADIEKQAKRLLDFVGLPWNTAVLDFHKKKRSVNTASVVQVRKPIYKSSVERWRPYEPYIQPMLKVLNNT